MHRKIADDDDDFELVQRQPQSEDMQIDEAQQPHNQDEGQLRQIRSQYRDLTNNITEDSNLINTIQQANVLFANVARPNEATLDSRALVESAQLGAKKSREMQRTNQSFQFKDFLAKLKVFMDEDEGALSELAAKLMVTAPRMSFMYGVVGSTTVKERTQAQRQRKERDVTPTKAEHIDVDELQKNGESSTTASVSAVYTRLVDTGPTEFWRFVLNPESFGQSVENTFFVAFLIRDGRVKVEMQGDVGILIPLSDADADSYQNQDLERQQYMATLDFVGWEKKCRELNLEESVIKTRAPAVGQ